MVIDFQRRARKIVSYGTKTVGRAQYMNKLLQRYVGHEHLSVGILCLAYTKHYAVAFSYIFAFLCSCFFIPMSALAFWAKLWFIIGFIDPFVVASAAFVNSYRICFHVSSFYIDVRYTFWPKIPITVYLRVSCAVCFWYCGQLLLMPGTDTYNRILPQNGHECKDLIFRIIFFCFQFFPVLPAEDNRLLPLSVTAAIQRIIICNYSHTLIVTAPVVFS